MFTQCLIKCFFKLLQNVFIHLLLFLKPPHSSQSAIHVADWQAIVTVNLCRNSKSHCLVASLIVCTIKTIKIILHIYQFKFFLLFFSGELKRSNNEEYAIRSCMSRWVSKTDNNNWNCIIFLWRRHPKKKVLLSFPHAMLLNPPEK